MRHYKVKQNCKKKLNLIGSLGHHQKIDIKIIVGSMVPDIHAKFHKSAIHHAPSNQALPNIIRTTQCTKMT